MWVRGVDANKRIVTIHSCSLLKGDMMWRLYELSFSFSFIGHILAQMKICYNWVHHVLKFLVTFLLWTTNTALWCEFVCLEISSRRSFLSYQHSYVWDSSRSKKDISRQWSPRLNPHFTLNIWCFFARFWKGKRTDVQTTRVKIRITSGREYRSAMWIKRWKETQRNALRNGLRHFWCRESYFFFFSSATSIPKWKHWDWSFSRKSSVGARRATSRGNEYNHQKFLNLSSHQRAGWPKTAAKF